MKRSVSLGTVILALAVLAMLVVLPVSGAMVVATIATVAPGVRPSVTATISSMIPSVGDPVTISGVATGGNLSAGVRIWVFAGNYVNVSTVPVNAGGTYSKTYQTAGFPPATYYVFVQSPGNDGTFALGLDDTGAYSGQVVNTRTGALLFNFTGTGSYQDAAASTALSDLFNLPGVDDVYTRLTFHLVAPATAAPTALPVSPAATATAVPPTTKSPLSPVPILAGLGIAGLACARFLRR
jgi:hypothetical protein